MIDICSFDMDEMLKSLNFIEKSYKNSDIYDPKYLYNKMLNLNVEKIIEWMDENPNHTFPKSEGAWINVIKMHFPKYTYYFSVDEIYNLVINEEKVGVEYIEDMLKKARKLIYKKQYSKDEYYLYRGYLSGFCNITHTFDPHQIYERLMRKINNKKRSI